MASGMPWKRIGQAKLTRDIWEMMFGDLRFGYWLLFAIVALEFFICASFGTARFTVLFGIDGLSGVLPGWVLLPLLWFGYLAIEITRRKVDHPFKAIRMLTYRHRYWLLRGMLFIAIMLPVARAFTSYKSAIPSIVPYFADPFLIDADKALFGVDPWRITHALIGPLGTAVIDRVYALWFVVMMLLLGWLCFTRNQKLQLRGLLTYLLSWALLGNLVATGLASVGPCFYAEFFHNERFTPLMQTLRANHEVHPIFALGGMDFLLDSIGKDRFGAGISAMPSLHVTIAFLCFLVSLESTKRLWPKLLAGAFAATIMVGSVHLGWHYAVDGIAGIIGVTLIWIAAGRFVDWVEARYSKNQPAPPHLIRLEPA